MCLNTGKPTNIYIYIRQIIIIHIYIYMEREREREVGIHAYHTYLTMLNAIIIFTNEKITLIR